MEAGTRSAWLVSWKMKNIAYIKASTGENIKEIKSLILYSDFYTLTLSNRPNTRGHCCSAHKVTIRIVDIFFQNLPLKWLQLSSFLGTSDNKQIRNIKTLFSASLWLEFAIIGRVLIKIINNQTAGRFRCLFCRRTQMKLIFPLISRHTFFLLGWFYSASLITLFLYSMTNMQANCQLFTGL